MKILPGATTNALLAHEYFYNRSHKTDIFVFLLCSTTLLLLAPNVAPSAMYY